MKGIVMKRFSAALLFSATLTPLDIQGQALSGVEQRIAGEVDARATEAIDLLERAVNINSGSMNFDGVREVGALFRQKLDALGFETEWIDLPTLAIQTKRAAILMHRLTRRPGAE